LALLPFFTYSNSNEAALTQDEIVIIEDEMEDKIVELVTDSRIKTYMYSPDEVFLLVLHEGFQSNIEFAKGEKVQTISLGDKYSWQITPIDNLLFIRPLEENAHTNMTIITNKHKYQFDLVAKAYKNAEDSQLIYSVKFCYPKKLKKNGKR
jgi:type IV secretion system protein VirB9